MHTLFCSVFCVYSLLVYEHLYDTCFKFFVRQLINMHSFRVRFCSFVLFLWLGHVFPFLCMPCNLLLKFGHLRKQSPLSVFACWLHAGKSFSDKLSQRFWYLKPVLMACCSWCLLWQCSSNVLLASLFSAFQTLVLQVRQDRHEFLGKPECWTHNPVFCLFPKEETPEFKVVPGCSRRCCIVKGTWVDPPNVTCFLVPFTWFYNSLVLYLLNWFPEFSPRYSGPHVFNSVSLWRGRGLAVS